MAPSVGALGGPRSAGSGAADPERTITGSADTDTDADTDSDTDSDTGDCIALAETCNGLDDDCDGSVDEAGAAGESVYFADADDDSFGDAGSSVTACALPEGYVSDNTDCDDAQGDVHPGHLEVGNDGVDNDCDPSTAVAMNIYESFSATANPFGNWSFGDAIEADGTGFTAFARYAEFDASVDYWEIAEGGEPRAYRNHTAADWVYASVNFAAKSIVLHPGPAGQFAVLRWTAPASTECQVAVTFDGRDSTTTAVATYVGGVLLSGGVVSGFGATVPVSGTFLVSAGDTVDFSVGMDGNYYYDSTGLVGTLACR